MAGSGTVGRGSGAVEITRWHRNERDEKKGEVVGRGAAERQEKTTGVGGGGRKGAATCAAAAGTSCGREGNEALRQGIEGKKENCFQLGSNPGVVEPFRMPSNVEAYPLELCHRGFVLRDQTHHIESECIDRIL